MTFLHGTALANQIARTLRGNRQDVAVAFIGKGAAERLGIRRGSKARIICDLFSGACNPAAIKELRKTGATLKRRDRLHAKVYLGDSSAVICSANASTSGFAEVGEEQNFGLEAGFVTSDPRHLEEIETWFEAQFDDAEDVGDEDVRAAESLWLRRPSRALLETGLGAERSVLARAIRKPGAFPGLGFVFTNSVVPGEKEVALRDARKEHPELAPELTSQLQVFYGWEKADVRKWPEAFLAYHHGSRGNLYLNANIFVVENLKRGDVFAKRDWRRLSGKHLGGFSKDPILEADRAIALEIMKHMEGGKMFTTAFELAAFYEEHAGSAGRALKV